MRALALVLGRDRVVGVASILVVVVAIALMVASSADLAAAATRASTTAMFVVSIAGALVTASVWGYVHESELEQVGHNSGTPARWIRGRLFALLIIAVMVVTVGLLDAAMAAAWAKGAGWNLNAQTAREVGWTLASLPTTIAVATVVSWHQPRTRALARAAVVTMVPLLVFLGPRMTARPWVLALSPTTSPAVLLAPSQYPSAAVVLAAASLASAWVGALMVLCSRRVDFTERPGRELVIAEPALSGQRAIARRKRALVGSMLAVAVVGAIGPSLGEKIPYEMRYAAGVQASRGAGPADAVRAYVTSYSQGKLVTAATWTSSGDAHKPLEGLVVAFAQRVVSSPMAVESSPDIRTASVRIQASSRVFHACMKRPGRQWLVEKISEAPCG